MLPLPSWSSQFRPCSRQRGDWLPPSPAGFQTQAHPFSHLKLGLRGLECIAVVTAKRQETGEEPLVHGEAVQGSRDSIMKQVSKLQSAASGKDPDSHQSIAVWWFLTKEVQGKNSSGGDLNPASWGVVTAWLIHKKGNKLISSHVNPKTHCPLTPRTLWDRVFCSVLGRRGTSSPEPQNRRGLSSYTTSTVTLISG